MEYAVENSIDGEQLPFCRCLPGGRFVFDMNDVLKTYIMSKVSILANL